MNIRIICEIAYRIVGVELDRGLSPRVLLLVHEGVPVEVAGSSFPPRGIQAAASLAPSFQHVDIVLHDYFFIEMVPALRGFAANPLCADGGTRLVSGVAAGRCMLAGGIVGCGIDPLGVVYI